MIDKIREAIKERNLIFNHAIHRGMIRIYDVDVQAYLSADNKVIQLIDEFHSKLIEEGKA